MLQGVIATPAGSVSGYLQNTTRNPGGFQVPTGFMLFR